MTTTQRTPLEGLAWAIEQFEGGFQNDPDDSGNWVYLNDGTRKLIGTNHGVTPAALAHYTGQDPATVTVAQICNVTAEFAAKIGFDGYYDAPGWPRMPYSHMVDALVDFGWGSGPCLAVMKMRSLIGTAPDGMIGPLTRRAWHDFTDQDERNQLVDICLMRIEHYQAVVKKAPATAKYLAGWSRRARSYLHGTPWFKLWHPDAPLTVDPER